ncbi:MAG TPA: cupredoxin family copper-binding protein [Chitinophagaceae bacterium]|nr:cupredoxin family copper-binding protein [Chitinophagaceae bacterium]
MTLSPKNFAWLLVCFLGAGLFAGCKKNTGGYPNGGMAAKGGSNSDSVIIQNYAFSPATVTIKAGTTVTWTNKDGVTHSVTADDVDDGSFDADDSSYYSGDIPNGSSYTHTFSYAGTYTYHCRFHTYMKGSVVVH